MGNQPAIEITPPPDNIEWICHDGSGSLSSRSTGPLSDRSNGSLSDRSTMEPRRSRTFEEFISSVRSIPNDSATVKLFARNNLTIGYVKWEDTARDKKSCLGPNISDVTLDVDNKSFPIIGTKNYSDPTFDMGIDKFSVNVGNEKKSGSIKNIPFKEYLQNLDQYIAAKITGSMFRFRDSMIVTSAQSCILPLQDDKITFNVRIHNYQYDAENPSVLVVVVSPHGTSAQLITESQQKIYFNKCGNKAPYVAERLADVRRTLRKSTTGDMSQEEKENNVLFIFQIPLKQKERPRRNKSFQDCRFDGVDKLVKKSRAYETRGMDHAQLSVGDSVGSWNGTHSGYIIERDAKYPIRCTIQYYRVTDTDAIPQSVVEDISQQIWKLYDNTPSHEKGSLVTDPPSGRITEPILSTKPSGSIFTF
jgi:hypothetical protein